MEFRPTHAVTVMVNVSPQLAQHQVIVFLVSLSLLSPARLGRTHPALTPGLINHLQLVNHELILVSYKSLLVF